MIERGIPIELIEEAIKRGSKVKQTEGLLAIYKYTRGHK